MDNKKHKKIINLILENEGMHEKEKKEWIDIINDPSIDEELKMKLYDILIEEKEEIERINKNIFLFNDWFNKNKNNFEKELLSLNNEINKSFIEIYEKGINLIKNIYFNISFDITVSDEEGFFEIILFIDGDKLEDDEYFINLIIENVHIDKWKILKE